MRFWLTYSLLLFLRRLSRIFFRFEWHWVHPGDADRWRDFRLVAILNHTSLFEFLLAGGVSKTFLRRMAAHGVVPIAAKTIDRPLIGMFWRWIAGNVVSISRERDHTWQNVLQSIDTNSMVIILPEGRMKRANGLDAHGRPLVIRAGIAEILETIPAGELLLAYSEGLHHIQIPGQRFPTLFKTIRLRLETIDIAAYRDQIRQQAGSGSGAFRRAVIADLTARRDRYCDAEVDTSTFELESPALDAVTPK